MAKFAPNKWRLTVGLFLLMGLMAFQTAALAQSSAAVVMYHRFGESDFPSTNVTMEQFKSHIEAMKTGGYNIVALPTLVDMLRSGEELPDKTLAVTIDDGYASIYDNAYPLFKEAGIPFSIFVSTDAVDRGYTGYMSWDQVRELSEDPLVYIGAHTASHMHMAAASPARIGDEMTRSLETLEKQLGYRPDIFAFPYGEASIEAINVVRGFGMKAAFGQHSGAIGTGDNLYYLARFALNEKFGDIKRFEMVSKTKSLFATDLGPKDMMVGSRNPPNFGFTVSEEVGSLAPLACFSSHEGKLRLEKLWERRIEVRMEKPLPVGRTRLNCTMPAGDGRWHWFGRQFYVAP